MSNKLTRQRKWLLGVMGLGIAAVVVDRTLMGDPVAANAASGPGDSAALLIDASEREADAPAAAPTAAPGEGPLDLSDFSQRLAGLSPIDSVAGSGRGDAFEPPAAWVVVPQPTPETGPAQPVTTPLSPAEFQQRHELNGTMNADGVQIAVLDSKPYRVGQIVDGYVLRRVATRQAVWESSLTGESVVLRESE